MRAPTALTLFAAVLVLDLGCASGAPQGPAADADHDGVPDARDRCLDTAQLTKLPADFLFAPAVDARRLAPGAQAYPVDRTGCEPDDDGDAVVNSRDYCPDDPPDALMAGVAANGCPRQSDFDGTPDYRDRCPGTGRNTPADSDGCPLSASS